MRMGRGRLVPREITDKDEFSKLLADATEVRVVHHGESAKIKLRLRGTLFTFKTTTEEADSMAKSAKVPVQEF